MKVKRFAWAAVVIFGAFLGLSRMATPVERMPFSELEAQAKACEQSGKVATDSRCKQISVAYSQEWHRRAEAARLERVKKEKINTELKIPSF